MNTKFIKYLLLVLPLALVSMFVSCDKSDDPEPTPGPVDTGYLPEITVLSRYEIIITDPHEVTFDITRGAAQANDFVRLESAVDSKLTRCEIASFTEKSVTVALPASIVEGSYKVYYCRGDKSRTCGTMQIVFVTKSFDPQPGTTVYGTISDSEGKPMSDVLVSDGQIFAKTNAEGQYELESTKPLPYVFMVVPSGYEPGVDGVFPQNFRALNFVNDKDKAERFDFVLTKVDQSKFNLLIFGDMHLANRNDDLEAYKKFTSDVSGYVADHADVKTYGVTLGDMSWDIYWNNYTLSDYAKNINSLLGGKLMIYHTIGNHDNDYTAVRSNYNAKNPYRRIIGPNYCSFNIGEIHFVLLDNIDCSDYDGTTSRNYSEQMTGDQLDWLRKDLQYVDKSTPLVIAMHAPVHSISGATQFKAKAGMASLASIVDGYKVDYITGHSHKSFNVVPSHNVIGGKDIREHNITAVCGDWWWSEKLTPGVHLAHDGSPAGYEIWNYNGKDVKWLYKGTGKSENVQFRSYDLNEVKFDFAEDGCSHLSGTARATFQKYVDAYSGKKDNYVLINVWNYNPSWTITVTQEDGKVLTPTAVTAYDPLHIAAMDVKRFRTATSSNPNFITSNHPHFFRVQCSNTTVDLKITVKDEFGHEWTEDMARPKIFGKTDAELRNYK